MKTTAERHERHFDKDVPTRDATIYTDDPACWVRDMFHSIGDRLQSGELKHGYVTWFRGAKCTVVEVFAHPVAFNGVPMSALAVMTNYTLRPAAERMRLAPKER